MKAFIARQGTELGEFTREQIEQLTRVGEFLPGDMYWEQGMEDWQPLVEVLGPNFWAKPEPPLSVRQRLAIGGGIALLALAIFALVIRWTITDAPSTPIATRAAAPVTQTAPLDQGAEKEVRAQAIDALRRKLQALPSQATAPLFLAYYDVAVEMRRSLMANTPYEVTIHGSENSVDPATQETTRRTTFDLLAEYTAGEWTFRRYLGSVQSTDNSDTIVIEAGPGSDTLPTIVTLLGLKVPAKP